MILWKRVWLSEVLFLMVHRFCLLASLDGCLRMVEDYCYLNKIKFKNWCLLPTIEDLLDSTLGMKYSTFESPHCTLGCYQIRLTEKDVLKTTFWTPLAHIINLRF